MYRLQVKTHFDAAHRLSDYVGKCNREHGHRWEIEVCIQGDGLDARNMLVDFGEVKELLKSVMDTHLDHWQLNESLGEPNPTAEFLAKWLFDRIHDEVVLWGFVLSRTCVWESPECCVKYSPTLDSVSD